MRASQAAIARGPRIKRPFPAASRWLAAGRARPVQVKVDGVSLMLWIGCAGCGTMLGLCAAWPWAWALGFVGLTTLGLLVIGASRRSAKQGLAAVTIAWSAWQLAGTGWVALAVRDGAHTTLWQLVVLAVLLVLQTAPAVGSWWLLDLATRRRHPAHDRDALHLTLRLGLTLACAESLRQWGWWGSGYAGLGTAFVELPGARLVVPALGGAGLGWLVWATSATWACAAWYRMAGARRAGRWAVGGVLLSSLAWCALWGLSRQPTPGWLQTRPGSDLSVIAVQPPAERGRHWTPQERDDALAQLSQAIRGAAPGTVLVTAETFFPEPPPRVAWGAWLDLVKLIRARGVHVLVGMPHMLRDETGLHMINAVVQLSPERQSLYAKERLVPGGEYLPWPETLGPVYAQVFEKARTGQQAGPPELTGPLFASGQPVGASICHELSFALTMSERAREATWLVNLADDMWIDNALYRQQMVSVARLRAMEAGKTLLRVSQGATSMLVSPEGEVLASAPDANARLMPLQVQTREGRTPYQRAAEWLVLLPLTLAVAWCLVALGRRVLFPRPMSNPTTTP